MKKSKASELLMQSAGPFNAGCMRVIEMEAEIEALASALAVMVNIFDAGKDMSVIANQTAIQQARDALKLSGHEDLINGGC